MPKARRLALVNNNQPPQGLVLDDRHHDLGLDRNAGIDGVHTQQSGLGLTIVQSIHMALGKGGQALLAQGNQRASGISRCRARQGRVKANALPDGHSFSDRPACVVGV